MVNEKISGFIFLLIKYGYDGDYNRIFKEYSTRNILTSNSITSSIDNIID